VDAAGGGSTDASQSAAVSVELAWPRRFGRNVANRSLLSHYTGKLHSAAGDIAASVDRASVRTVIAAAAILSQV
jgi:hypothetical protein